MVTLSVVMTTFNHERFIAQAIEGVLQQKTNFDFELIIAEDCSTDRTREIAAKYQNKYPETIKLICSKTNIGTSKNFDRARQACGGEYIAICDGDDYWTACNKLQKQVDFFRAHKGYTLCGHQVRLYYENEKRFGAFLPRGKNPISGDLKTFLKKDIQYPTSSLVFINTVWENVCELWYQVPYHDFLIKVLAAEKGRLAFINEPMGVYRIHGTSITNKDKTKFIAAEIKNFRLILGYLSHHRAYKYYMSRKLVDRIVAYHYLSGDRKHYWENLNKVLVLVEGNYGKKLMRYEILKSNIMVRIRTQCAVKYIYGKIKIILIRFSIYRRRLMDK